MLIMFLTACRIQAKRPPANRWVAAQGEQWHHSICGTVQAQIEGIYERVLQGLRYTITGVIASNRRRYRYSSSRKWFISSKSQSCFEGQRVRKQLKGGERTCSLNARSSARKRITSSGLRGLWQIQGRRMEGKTVHVAHISRVSSSTWESQSNQRRGRRACQTSSGRTFSIFRRRAFCTEASMLAYWERSEGHTMYDGPAVPPAKAAETCTVADN